MTENPEQKITIDNVDYTLGDLSDNAKGQLRGLQIAENEMKRLNTQLALAQTARNAYMQALQADLPKKEQ
ncbi:MAG: hypothetical protein KUG81_03520 [Gammaproteobacteria bacterium]|nr:hypothetical protein [Gammaproteobacteria bacterium]